MLTQAPSGLCACLGCPQRATQVVLSEDAGQTWEASAVLLQRHRTLRLVLDTAGVQVWQELAPEFCATHATEVAARRTARVVPRGEQYVPGRL